MILIKTKRDNLLSPLQAVSGIVERKQTLPILSNILLERKNETLVLLTTDNEIQITTKIELNETENISTTVNAKKLQDILRSLPDNIDVSIIIEEKRILIKAGKSRFNLQTLPAADFPVMSLSEDKFKKITITQKQLKKLLSQTQFSMAIQDVRYYLNGLFLLFEAAELRAVATDGHRLSYASITIENEEENLNQGLILPRKTVIELNRLLADIDEPLSIEFSNNQIQFKFSNIVLISKLIDGKFPDYQRVIPDVIKNSIVVNRLEFLQSLNRVSILTNEKFRGVRVVLSKNNLKIIAANAEQEEAKEEIEIIYEGDVVDAGFNVSYLIDVLNNTSSEFVTWGFNGASSSTLICPFENENIKYVVMPMRI